MLGVGEVVGPRTDAERTRLTEAGVAVRIEAFRANAERFGKAVDPEVLKMLGGLCGVH
jgi:hypothetical protein